MSKKITAVLFDLDDTLYSRDKAFRSWAVWFVRNQLLIEDELRHAAVVEGIVRMDEHGYAPREALFARIMEEHPALGIDVAQCIATYREQFMRHISPEEETTRVLHALVDAGIPFGIVTNGPVVQQHKLERLGLDCLTSCVFISEVFGSRKPDAGIFLAAASCLKAEPAEVLFVGDNPATDLLGAYGVGMQTAWLSYGREWPTHLAHFSPDFTLANLSDVLPLVVERTKETG
jgi:putative hydrolase of the HAD superfamily